MPKACIMTARTERALVAPGVLALASAMVALAPHAKAAEPDVAKVEQAQPTKREQPVSLAPEPESRRLPDYDGRPDHPPAPGALVWTGRVVFFPFYVVSEYVLRRPLGWAVVAAERANLATVLLDLFTFGEQRQAGLFPTALLDFGFKPSVGLYFFWNDVGFRGHTVRANAATWGKDWLRLALAERFELSGGMRIGWGFEAWDRPDWLFYGLGPDSDEDAAARYARLDLSGALRLEIPLPGSSHFGAYAAVRAADFSDSRCCDDPSITARIENGTYASPPGFRSGYTLLRHGFELALDSRLPRPYPGTGVRAVVRAEQNLRLAGDVADEWLRYGGTLGGFIDLTGRNRVIGLSVTTLLSENLDDEAAIPFTEQVVLGGNAPLRGFLEGRLVDQSALVAKLEYTWPVWIMLDGALSAEAGNVFGEHLDGLEGDRMRLSFGLGVRAHGRRDQPFEALLGFGTSQLRDGARPESLRLVFGTTNGF